MDDKEALKTHLKEYVRMITKPSKGRNMYVCPICNSGGHGTAKSDGAFSITPDGLRAKCFSCGWSGDLFSLIGEHENITDFKEAVKRARELFGSSPAMYPKSRTVKEPPEKERHIRKCHDEIFGTIGERYLNERGISRETIETFKIGYDKSLNGIVIPYPGKDYYTTRFLEPKNGYKYDKLPADMYGPEPLFICGDSNETLFICEGQIDAITLFQAGASAVAAIGGTGYEKLKQYKIKRAVYVMDNDEPGHKIADKVAEVLDEKGIPWTSVVPPLPDVKDINEAWVKDPGKVTELIIEADNSVKSYDRPDNVCDYLDVGFSTDVEKFKSYKELKTGYWNLDEVQNFYPGFYVIGAISSLGKTTFMHQMADQISKAGEPVIIFSLEQNKLELVSKGLSRMTAKHLDERLTAIQIRGGATNETLENAKAEYKDIVKNEYIVEAGFNTTIKNIEDYVEDFIKDYNVKPVVIIDYLQIIQPADSRQGAKEAVDTHVRALKSLQSKHDLVLVAISSLNRQNYLAPIDFESFKESGGIEYTADVIWGLQLQCLSDELFTKPNKIIEKRKKVTDAMTQDPRQVLLVCLKNRYGKSRYSCAFSYLPAYDTFIPDRSFRPLSDKEKKDLEEDDWEPTPSRTVI